MVSSSLEVKLLPGTFPLQFAVWEAEPCLVGIFLMEIFLLQSPVVKLSCPRADNRLHLMPVRSLIQILRWIFGLDHWAAGFSSSFPSPET